MPKILDLSLEDENELCTLAAALNSPARIQTLRLLYYNSLSVSEIAEKLHIPYSSAALYVKSLEDAGLISRRSSPPLVAPRRSAPGMPTRFPSS